VQHEDSRMKPIAPTQEALAGRVERVTFHNAENGFCVLRAKARGHRDLVTVVGHSATIAAGEWATATGEWVNDRTHGQQFKARFLRTSAPTSTEGIEKYLSSGTIRGIGPVYAKKLVRSFAERVFDVIEAEPDRLREVDGIGPVRAQRIVAAWAEQKVVREMRPDVAHKFDGPYLMRLLSENEIAPGRALPRLNLTQDRVAGFTFVRSVRSAHDVVLKMPGGKPPLCVRGGSRRRRRP
jgi:ATP-dependent exoDNAse (exonuclease V) alpha subunit